MKIAQEKQEIKNQEYHPDKWLCTYHADKAKVEGRRKRKYGNRTK